jgi:hypothetical protein
LTLFPGIDRAFLQIVDPHTAGDPDQDGVLWTNLSRPKIAEELWRRGFRVSVGVVSQLLQRHRLGRRKACKTLPLGRHADRDRQFQIIATHRTAFTESPDPIVSMDTKHKEFLGLLFRQGRLYTQKAKKALDHDFPSAATGVIYPHGFYDVKRNLGHLNLGLSHDTSRFACDSLSSWWQTQGQPAYPQARRMLLLCDGGGSNASNRYVFKPPWVRDPAARYSAPPSPWVVQNRSRTANAPRYSVVESPASAAIAVKSVFHSPGGGGRAFGSGWVARVEKVASSALRTSPASGGRFLP